MGEEEYTGNMVKPRQVFLDCFHCHHARPQLPSLPSAQQVLVGLAGLFLFSCDAGVDPMHALLVYLWMGVWVVGGWVWKHACGCVVERLGVGVAAAVVTHQRRLRHCVIHRQGQHEAARPMKRAQCQLDI